MESFGDVFENVLKYLYELETVSEVGYKTWLATLEPYKLENNTAYLLTESVFNDKTTTEIYTPMIKEAFENVLGFPVELKLLVKSKDSVSEQSEPEFVSKPAFGGSDSGDETMHKKPKYTFDNFIQGKSNELAFACCTAIANKLDDGSTVIVRPSGTEPKIKTYFTTKGKDLAEAQAKKDQLAEACKPLLS